MVDDGTRRWPATLNPIDRPLRINVLRCCDCDCGPPAVFALSVARFGAVIAVRNAFGCIVI
ncbi:hypothetical protein [Paracoccus sp. S4493]|uniref:hypothetical protein n=1 Tax=Paracoccus sp. S4493 TaxID=579490 RepID=UPI0012EEDF5A|nr:hypothetical protein [Paracoccus sp. S4493]